MAKVHPGQGRLTMLYDITVEVDTPYTGCITVHKKERIYINLAGRMRIIMYTSGKIIPLK